jgi:transposase-like protein
MANAGSIADRIGCVRQTLYKWLKKAYANTGRQQVSLQVCDKVKALKREVGHLGQANQICAGPPHI